MYISLSFHYILDFTFVVTLFEFWAEQTLNSNAAIVFNVLVKPSSHCVWVSFKVFLGYGLPSYHTRFHWHQCIGAPTMDGVRTFLESSTIHGLAYISTTRKLVKLFWIVIVIAGFTGAGIMIYQSFQSWEESPVKTTIQTLPIRDITFPMVTVCPPKNTYTNLNYDMIAIKNVSLDNQTRDYLLLNN